MQLSEDQLRVAVAREMPQVLADLKRLVRIPSVAFEGFDHEHVHRSAEAVAELLTGCGLQAEVVRGKGQPAVIAHSAAPAGAPTILLYAHHDVQPAGSPAAWTSAPFEPVERDGRLYGRGAADDKGGLMAHVAALRAWNDALPVGVVVFVEGEEEYGSQSLEDLLHTYRDDLRSDVIVIADSGNWDIGVPALTTALRGMVNCFVDVYTDASDAGQERPTAVSDPLTVLSRLIATMHDDNGNVAVEGLVQGANIPLDYPAERFRRESGILDGVQLIGDGSITEQLWARPSITLLGIDTPQVLAPSPGGHGRASPSVRAKLSIRLAPGDEAEAAYAAVRAHLEKHVGWGARIDVTLESSGDPCVIDATGPVYDAARSAFRVAWDGVDPVDIGVGGSIPFIASFQRLLPEASILVTGVEDPYSSIHGPDESIHLGEFAKVCLAEALLLGMLADTWARRESSN